VAGRYLSWLDEETDPDLSDLAWTAAVGRSHFAHRAGLVFNDLGTSAAETGCAGAPAGIRHEAPASGSSAALAQLRQQLEDLAAGEGGDTPRGVQKVAFVFTGQASQWPGMGRALYEREPVFRSVLDRCDRLLLEDRGISLLDVMFGENGTDGLLDEPAWTQPAIYSLECALVALWDSLGVRPSVVVGHSLGEIAAAQAAGGFTLEQGLRNAAARGALIEPALDELEAAVGEIAPSPPAPSVPLVSNITGRLLDPDARMDAAYWRRHAREPVAFRASVETLAEMGVDAVVEIGPHAVLGPVVSMIRPASAPAGSPPVLASLRRPPRDAEEPPIDTSGASPRRLPAPGKPASTSSSRACSPARSGADSPCPAIRSSASGTGSGHRSGGTRPTDIRCSASGTSRPAARSCSRRKCSPPIPRGCWITWCTNRWSSPADSTAAWRSRWP